MIELIFYVLIFIAGLFIGSFLNVVSDRIINKKSILFGRSECDHCFVTLKAKNLVPLLSYIFQRGKCQNCAKKLSWYYPISEIITGLVFVSAAWLIRLLDNTQNPLIWILFAYFLIVGSVYVIITLTDLKYRLIPNKIIYPALVFVFVFLIFNFTYTLVSIYNNLIADEFGRYLIESGFFEGQAIQMAKGFGYAVLSTLGIGIFFWVLTRIKDGKAMGGGDVKLALLIGLFNGFPYNIIAIFIAFLIGALYGVALMIFGKKGMKDTVPFGPFLVLGSLIALVWGPLFLNWYLGLF